MLKQTQYFEKKANATTTIIIITIIVLFWGRRKKQFTAEDCQISACSFIGNINNYIVMIIFITVTLTFYCYCCSIVSHYCVSLTLSSVLQLLIEYNADINVTDRLGYCPLYLALQGGRRELVETILDANPKMDIMTGVSL